jgi:cation-transporting ATPase E
VATVQAGEPVTNEGNGHGPGLLGRLRNRLRPASRAEGAPAAEGEEDGKANGKPSGFLGRMTRRVRNVLRRGGEEKDSQEAVEEPPAEETVLLFAYRAAYTPLHTPDGTAQMPADLVPLCKLHISERVRPEAIETIRIFSEVGVDIKVFTPSTADETVASLRQAGLGSGEKERLTTISGPELAALDAGQLARAAHQTTVFGQVTPEQAGQVVAVLRAEGERVAVVGDGVSDLPAMRQANLAISRQSSTQAALGLADLVLLGDSPAVLSGVLEKGQRIVNGLLDVLKVQLTQVSYLALLILAIPIVAYGFPYQSAQGTIISVVTVALPSAGLTLWAMSGVLPSTGLGRLLAHTVIPAAVTMSGAALIVYLYILNDRGDVPYAQLAVTWTLVITGSLLVVLIKPPWPTRVGGVARAGDPKPAALSLVLLVLFVLVTALPVTERFLKTTWLHRPEDYLLVVAVSFGWLLTLSLIWRAIPLVRRVRD